MRDGGGMLGENRCGAVWESSVIVATIATGTTTSLRLAMLLRKLGRLLQEIHIRKTTKNKHKKKKKKKSNNNSNKKDVHKTLEEKSKC
jgi:mannitol-specific phosphotransferase system IIBC component